MRIFPSILLRVKLVSLIIIPVIIKEKLRVVAFHSICRETAEKRSDQKGPTPKSVAFNQPIPACHTYNEDKKVQFIISPEDLSIPLRPYPSLPLQILPHEGIPGTAPATAPPANQFALSSFPRQEQTFVDVIANREAPRCHGPAN